MRTSAWRPAHLTRSSAGFLGSCSKPLERITHRLVEVEYVLTGVFPAELTSAGHNKPSSSMRFGKRTNASPRAFQTQTLHKWYLMRRTMRAAPPLTGHQFAKLPVYQQKLQTLRKDMIGLSDRVDRLKKRAGTINSSASSASMLIFRHFCRETPTAEAPRGARACSSTREASTSSIKGRSETACMSLYSIISIQQHHRDLMCHCESSARTRAHTRLSV